MINEEYYKKKYLDALETEREILEFYRRPGYKDVREYAEPDLTDIFPKLKEWAKVVVTNAKTGKFFYATGVVIDKGHYNGRLYVPPCLTIIVKDVDVTVPVLGTKYLRDESGVITKKEAIGGNEKIKIQYCSDDGTIEYESTILNAWIREVDRDNGIIQLHCDHVI